MRTLILALTIVTLPLVSAHAYDYSRPQNDQYWQNFSRQQQEDFNRRMDAQSAANDAAAAARAAERRHHEIMQELRQLQK
jgi:hypothetical protein